MIFIATTFLLFCITLFFEYKKFQEFTKFSDITLSAKVLNQYLKNGYYVLKMRSDDGVEFYTSASNQIRDIKFHEVDVKLFLNEMSFLEFVNGFYARSDILKLYPMDSFKANIFTSITDQHSDEKMKEIFLTLFFATPINLELRQKLATLGLSHIVAISGFHLGLLSVFFFFILKYPYRFFQDKLFPYRSSHRDLFSITALLLFAYMAFLDFPPSLLRSYAMLIIGYFLYDRGVKIISMQTLFVSVLLLIALFPKLLLSIAFWLSVGGVFYIFLYLLYFTHLQKWVTFVALPIFVFFMMFVSSLYIFEIFSPLQLISIILTFAFIIFYPIEIALHILEFGDLFDSYLIKLFDIAKEYKIIKIDLSLFITHILLSFGAIFSKKILYILIFTTLLLYLFVAFVSVYEITYF